MTTDATSRPITDPWIVDITTAIAIITFALGRASTGAGTIECPRCGGTLQYRVTGPRAMRGICDTDGCLRFLS